MQSPPLPPPPPVSAGGGGSSSLLEQPLNATDIVNAKMSVVSSVFNLDVYIIVTPDTNACLLMLL